MYYLPYSTYFPEGKGEEEGESGERIKRSRQQKQQTTTTTTSTSTSRYLLPFLRITVSVAWYIYLTVLKCICNVGLKKIISRSIKLLYHTLHLHVPSPTRSPYFTSPYIQFSPYPYLPNNTFPYPTISSLSDYIWPLSTYPPTLPYPSILGIQCPAFPFPLPALHYLHIHTYILSFLPAQPTSRYVGRYLPYLPTFPTYQPSLAVCPPACLSCPILYVVCVGNDDDEKEYFGGSKGT